MLKPINTAELTDQTLNVVNVTLHCVGIKKRARKVTRHRFDLGYFPRDIKPELFKPLAMERLMLEMRETAQASIHVTNSNLRIQGNMLIHSLSSDDIFNFTEIKLELNHA